MAGMVAAAIPMPGITGVDSGRNVSWISFAISSSFVYRSFSAVVRRRLPILVQRSAAIVLNETARSSNSSPVLISTR